MRFTLTEDYTLRLDPEGTFETAEPLNPDRYHVALIEPDSETVLEMFSFKTRAEVNASLLVSGAVDDLQTWLVEVELDRAPTLSVTLQTTFEFDLEYACERCNRNIDDLISAELSREELTLYFGDGKYTLSASEYATTEGYSTYADRTDLSSLVTFRR